MAVSQRTRYEVLRRDRFTCRYCRSTEGQLTIDHVVPESLGGSDKPENLVACCKDCNAGKSSTAPDSELIQEIDDKAMTWAKARAKVVADVKRERAASKRRNARLVTAWKKWDEDARHLPHDWSESVDLWVAQGIGMDRILDAHRIALSRTTVESEYVFAYMAGIIRNWVADIDARTTRLIEAEAATERRPDRRALEDAYSCGRDDHFLLWMGEITGGAVLRHHIDGTSDRVPEDIRFVSSAVA